MTVTTLPSRTASPPSSREDACFVGVSDWTGREVWIEHGAGPDERLRYRGDQLADGFVWGHYGYAARELARSILHEMTGSAVLAELRCRDFAREVVAQLPADAFRLSGADVLAWIEHDRLPQALRG